MSCVDEIGIVWWDIVEMGKEWEFLSRQIVRFSVYVVFQENEAFVETVLDGGDDGKPRLGAFGTEGQRRLKDPVHSLPS